MLLRPRPRPVGTAHFTRLLPLLCAAVLFVVSPSAAQSNPVVSLPYFSVEGVTQAINTSATQPVLVPTNVTAFDIFYGVPYAQPPVGALRFEKPQALSAAYPYANQTLNCTTYLNIPFCHQGADPSYVNDPPLIGEDCLKSIIVRPAGTTPSAQLPVLVYIHGGGWSTGAALLQSPGWPVKAFLGPSQSIPNFYVVQGMIVVLLQYRLTLFGFASDGTAQLPGNYGLFDQQLALQWIAANIGAFGGDASRVTLFGESAGAVSVALHAVQPNSSAHFQRAWQISGAYGVPWSMDANSTVTATQAIGAALNCSAAGLKACLQAADDWTLSSLLKTVTPRYKPAVNFVQYTPVYDGDFFYLADYAAMVAAAAPKPTVMSFSSDEGASFNGYVGTGVPNYTYQSNAYAFGLSDLTTLINYYVQPLHPSDSSAVAQVNSIRSAVLAFYTGQADSSLNYTYYQQYTNFYTDIAFLIPIVWEARLKAQNGWPLEVYHFSYCISSLLPCSSMPYPQVGHTNDVLYLFGHGGALSWPNMSPTDNVLEPYLVNALADFALNGTTHAEWPPLKYSAKGKCKCAGAKKCKWDARNPYVAMNVNPTPYVESASNGSQSSLAARFAFWDELSAQYDLGLAYNLPKTMGVCLPHAGGCSNC